MLISQAFSRLGIPVSRDIPTIKKAYQKLLPQHHPEEDPRGFMLLHEAYKTALNYAQNNSTPTVSTYSPFSRTQEKPRPIREETGYDSLFSGLETDSATDMEQLKQEFTKKLRPLKLHWLPIPLKHWCRFFSSEPFLLCRKEPECMEQLFAVLVKKIHSYHVLLFLLNQLWELDSWQKSEGADPLSTRTQACISALQQQYSHYLKLNPSAKIRRILLPLFWYYQAIPSLFKLPAATILFPVIVSDSTMELMALVFIFHILEFLGWIRKNANYLGVFHTPVWYKEKIPSYKKTRWDTGDFIAAFFYMFLFHFAACFYIMEKIAGR